MSAGLRLVDLPPMPSEDEIAWTGIPMHRAAPAVLDSDLPKSHPGTEAAAEPVSADPAPRPPRWQRAVDVIAEPAPVEIVQGIAWAGGITSLSGPPASAKTFVTLSISAAVSADLRWYGRQVRQGAVVYFSFEGHLGIRLRALREVAGHWLEHVFIVPATDPLSPTTDRDKREIPSCGELDAARDLDQIAADLEARERPPVVLVVVDTVRASLAGSEDSSESVSAYLRAVRRLLTHAPGAAALLVHHAGWQDGENARKRERGSSAFRGNVDGSLYLEADDYDAERGQARLTLTTLKVRDGEAWPPLHLVRRRVEIPSLVDRWGEPVTSCLIEEDPRSSEDRKAEQAQAAEAEHQAVDLRTLRKILERPDLTSLEGLRAALRMSRPAAGDSLARLVDRRWVLPKESQRQPYVATPAGKAALGEAQS